MFGELPMLNEGHFSNFAPKLVVMAKFLEESGKLLWIDNIYANTFHLVKKS